MSNCCWQYVNVSFGCVKEWLRHRWHFSISHLPTYDREVSGNMKDNGISKKERSDNGRLGGLSLRVCVCWGGGYLSFAAIHVIPQSHLMLEAWNVCVCVCILYVLILGRMCYALRTASILCSMDPTGYGKASFKIQVHVDMIASDNCCRFVSYIFMLWISCSTTQK